MAKKDEWQLPSGAGAEGHGTGACQLGCGEECYRLEQDASHHTRSASLRGAGRRALGMTGNGALSIRLFLKDAHSALSDWPG